MPVAVRVPCGAPWQETKYIASQRATKTYNAATGSALGGALTRQDGREKGCPWRFGGRAGPWQGPGEGLREKAWAKRPGRRGLGEEAWAKRPGRKGLGEKAWAKRHERKGLCEKAWAKRHERKGLCEKAWAKRPGRKGLGEKAWTKWPGRK